jgi:hypothetical protein
VRLCVRSAAQSRRVSVSVREEIVKHTLSILALLLTACVQQSAKPTQIIGVHTTVTARNVQQWHNFQHPKCRYIKVASTYVIVVEPDFVTEYWAIEACNHQVFTYSVNRSGITDTVSFDSVSFVDESPAKVK